MKRCLVDVNVVLALMVRQHVHHDVALTWFDGLAAGEAGLCRFVQLAVIRLLGNHAVMSEHAVAARVAWRLIDDLLQDERLEFLAEPSGVDSILPQLFKHPVPTGKLVADAYLAAFAMAASFRMVTLDAGFRQFKGLTVDLLHAG
jgi:uncharacterized protein